jgi:hypothetical protein
LAHQGQINPQIGKVRAKRESFPQALRKQDKGRKAKECGKADHVGYECHENR